MKEKDFYFIMHKFQEVFNKQVVEDPMDCKFSGNVESEYFYGSYQLFDPSGGRLVIGKNLLDENGVAVVKQDMGFQAKIFPKYCDNVPPFHIDIDNHRVSISGKIAHINDAYGEHYDITTEIMKGIKPENVFDLMKISSQALCQKAITRSMNRWEQK